MSVALRRLVAADAAWLDAWFPAVAAVVVYHVDDDRGAGPLLKRARDDASLRAHVIRHDNEDIGVVVTRAGAPDRTTAIIEIVAIRPERARGGHGMTAAAMAEADLRKRGVKTVYAPVAAMHGISMYFWIRLGYRPLLRPEWPCDRPGVAWLSRTA